jgi:hypothetical protein
MERLKILVVIALLEKMVKKTRFIRRTCVSHSSKMQWFPSDMRFNIVHHEEVTGHAGFMRSSTLLNAIMSRTNYVPVHHALLLQASIFCVDIQTRF